MMMMMQWRQCWRFIQMTTNILAFLTPCAQMCKRVCTSFAMTKILHRARLLTNKKRSDILYSNPSLYPYIAQITYYTTRFQFDQRKAKTNLHKHIRHYCAPSQQAEDENRKSISEWATIPWAWKALCRRQGGRSRVFQDTFQLPDTRQRSDICIFSSVSGSILDTEAGNLVIFIFIICFFAYFGCFEF